MFWISLIVGAGKPEVNLHVSKDSIGSNGEVVGNINADMQIIKSFFVEPQISRIAQMKDKSVFLDLHGLKTAVWERQFYKYLILYMKLFLCALIFSFISINGSAQFHTQITEDDIYDFMNEAVFNMGKRVLVQDSIDNTKYSSWNCYNQDSVVIYEFDCIIKEMIADTLHYFIDSMDIIFMKEQLSQNKMMVWEDEKLNRKIKVTHKQRLLATNYALPLFSKDKKTVVIGVGSVWGYQAFHFNSTSKKWELIDFIQTGT